jgi:hypothetical protein
VHLSSLLAVRAVLVLALVASTAHADMRSLIDVAFESANATHAIEPTNMSRPVEPAAELSAASAASVAADASDAEQRPDAPLDKLVGAGRQWRLDTPHGPIHVWIPANYDPATAATIVFVHGYWVHVDEAWDAYRLPQQFALSGINAMFIAPSAPSAKWIRLAWPSLDDLVHTVAGSVNVPMPTKRLVIVGHSGAYRTLAVWLADPALDTVVILDGVYGEYSFLPWVRSSPQHRLVNIVYETGSFSDYLHSQLPSTVRVSGLPLDGLPDARILYVRTMVGHWQLVTDGVALPLALRAIGVPNVASARLDLPLGLSPTCDAPRSDDGGIEHSPFAPRISELPQ